MKNTGIILLAAGSSARMGSPKQLLPYQDKTLLERILETSLQVFERNHIILVLGSRYEEISASIKKYNVPIHLNQDWKTGIASSIQSGLQALLSNVPDLERCFISVCDQPYLNAGIFHEMRILQDASSKEIIACEYADTLGVPALFSKKYFDDLVHLTGDQGAKKIIHKNMKDVYSFPFEKGAIDIDTKSDYDNLNNTTE